MEEREERGRRGERSERKGRAEWKREKDTEECERERVREEEEEEERTEGLHEESGRERRGGTNRARRGVGNGLHGARKPSLARCAFPTVGRKRGNGSCWHRPHPRRTDTWTNTPWGARRCLQARAPAQTTCRPPCASKHVGSNRIATRGRERAVAQEGDASSCKPTLRGRTSIHITMIAVARTAVAKTCHRKIRCRVGF